jgi:transketolase
MSTTTSTQIDELCVNTIRTLSMDAVEKAKSGHPGTPMALAPLAYVLYTRLMRHSPEQPEWFDRDRFVLSAGHASMLLYSVLYLTGYGLTLDDLKNFRQLGSPTPGHPEYRHAPGVEATTGPLGQGLGMSVGLALAEAMLAARFNRPGHEIIDHRTYVIASDGDIQEGVGSEACSLAGHLGLGKLTVFFDNNHIQLAGETSMAFSEDVGKRFEAYGWHVQDLGEDLSLDRLAGAAEAARDVPDRPSLVIVRSHIGYGSPHKQDTYQAHGSPLGEEEVALTKEGYGWDPDAKFLVPDEALAHFREAVPRGKELVDDWNERLEAYRSDEPEAYEQLAMIMERRLPEGWDREVPKFRPEAGMIATRKASKQVIQWAAAGVPQLVSGSADLEPSTLTEIDGGGSVERGDYAGRNVHYGVREHGMGAAVNGLNLHGLRAFGSTFFNFLDYMKPAVDLRVHARLDRARRGRPHAPADRAARDPAGHAEHLRGAARRGERDGARVAVRDQPDRDPRGARLQPPGPAGLESRRRARGRDRSRRIRPAGVLQGGAGPDPDRDRLRAAHLHGGGRPPRGGRGRHPRRVRPLPRPLRRAGPGVPRPDTAALRAGARLRRGRLDARLEHLDHGGR